MRIQSFFFVFVTFFISGEVFSQTKFEVSHYNYYVLKDSVNGISYSFDSGSEDSNLFDRGRLQYKKRGFSLIQNVDGKFRIILKARLTTHIDGLGEVAAKANILADTAFTKKHCIDIDLLLGMRELKRHILHFDNRGGMMTKLQELPPDIHTYARLELTSNIFGDKFFTTLDINGKKQKFLVDTGYSGGLTVNSGEYLSEKVDEVAYYELAAFLSQEARQEKYAGNALLHKGVRFKTDVVYCAPGRSNMLGNSFFLNFEEVIFDFKGKCIYLRNETTTHDPFPYDILFSATDDGRIEVVYIKASCHHHQQGVRLGDIIKLEDSELETQLLSNPCATLSILAAWKAKHNTTPEFVKVSG